MFASAVLQDVLGTARALFCLLLDGRERCIFLFDPGFGVGSFLVGFAGFILVPRAVAWDAGFAAAFVACKDVWTGRSRVVFEALLSLPHLPQLLRLLWRKIIHYPLRDILGQDAKRTTMSAGPLESIRAFSIAILALHLAWDVDLSVLASGSKTPAPPRSILSSVNSLQLNIPSKRSRQQPNPTKAAPERKRPGSTNLAKSFFGTATSTSSLPIFCSHSGHAIRGAKTLVSICDSTHSLRQRLHVLIRCSHVEVGLLSGNCEEMRLTMHVWHS